jgi:hypothetical protein
MKMAVFWVVAPCSLVEVYHPEDSHLRTDRRENLKSYPVSLFSVTSVLITFCIRIFISKLYFITDFD